MSFFEYFKLKPITTKSNIDRDTFIKYVIVARDRYGESWVDSESLKPSPDERVDFSGSAFAEWLKVHNPLMWEKFVKFNENKDFFHLSVEDSFCTPLYVIDVIQEGLLQEKGLSECYGAMNTEEQKEYVAIDDLCYDLFVDYCIEHPALAKAVYDGICDFLSECYEEDIEDMEDEDDEDEDDDDF